ncbi:unnamed protein product [Staurois parvus]|uniref:Uncharacterized protein n=1 Tax=Staurois parvus TaxID=386267 RepID=A0ABN9G868_9NEOB|nr:unnamed protein product [Staurois parvus]
MSCQSTPGQKVYKTENYGNQHFQNKGGVIILQVSGGNQGGRVFLRDVIRVSGM